MLAAAAHQLDGDPRVPALRLKRISAHVLVAAATQAVEARTKSFTKGVLAHLLLVPGWVLSPLALVGGAILAGAPRGATGMLTNLGLVGCLAAGPSDSNKMRALICAAMVALAARAKDKMKRNKALAGACVVSLLTWVCSTSRDNVSKGSQRFFDFVSTWGGDYYKETALRGALSDIRKGRSFFAFHPHGCLCAGFTVNGTYNPEFMRHAGKTNWLCDPNLRDKNPGFRLACELYKGEDRAIEACDVPTFKKLFSTGESIAFMPGGFRDAVAFAYNKETIALSDRKGFIKYCLQYGYRLHPCYTFGESETYYTFSWLRSHRMEIAKQNVPALAFFGWPLCPILPRPDSSLLTYVGEGIDMPHLPDPSPDEIDCWHARYIVELRKLFDTYKAEVGKADVELEIL